MIVYESQYLLPVATPLVRDGALAVADGRIVAVGPRAEVLQEAEEEAEAAGDPVERRPLGRTVVLPGLVNAHVHVELSWAADVPEVAGCRDGWVAWVAALLAARGEVSESRAHEAATAAVETMVRRGTVAVGDVANEDWAAPLLARRGLAGVAFLETYGLCTDAARKIADKVLARCAGVRADEAVAAQGGLRVVPTPHAPQTTSTALLRSLARHAEADAAPLSIHAAESVAESEWLRDGSGPLATLYRERDFFTGPWEPPALSPVEYLHRLGVLGPRTLAVHCVQIDNNDRALLQASGASVVTCPRSNRRLGVGTAPVPELLREGIPVALGTDSLASSPDLDLFGEMAALCEEHPGLAPPAVVRMATLSGARALDVADRFGSLEAGKLAAAIAVPLPEDCDDPAAYLCTVPEVVHRLADAPVVTEDG